MNKIGVAAIIFAAAAFLTAVSTAIVNFLTFKWTAKIYEPYGRLAKKAEPMLDKMFDYSEKWFDEQTKEDEED